MLHLDLYVVITAVTDACSGLHRDSAATLPTSCFPHMRIEAWGGPRTDAYVQI